MSVVINSENFPDDGFRTFIANKFGLSVGGTISNAQIESTTSIAAPESANVHDVRGIEYFTELTNIEIALPELRSITSFSLDLSLFSSLDTFRLSSKTISSVNLVPNTHLKTIWFGTRYLSSFDFHAYISLESISIQWANYAHNSDPQMQCSVNTAGLDNLKVLHLYGNTGACALQNFNTENCSNIEDLIIADFDGSIQDFDFTHLTKLKRCGLSSVYKISSISFDSPYLWYLSIQGCIDSDRIDANTGQEKPISLDLGSSVSSLEELYIYQNRRFDLPRMYTAYEFDISDCVNLHRLVLADFIFKELDISNIPRLLNAYNDATPVIAFAYNYTDAGGTYRQSVECKVEYYEGHSPVPADADKHVIYQLVYLPYTSIVDGNLYISEEPEDIIVNSEELGTFSCEATGTSAVAYDWEYCNEYSNCPSYVSVDWTKFAESASTDVLAKPANEYFAYRCKTYLTNSQKEYIIRDRNGTEKSETRYHKYIYTEPVHMLIRYPLVINTQPQNVVCSNGEFASYLIEASNYRESIPADTWTRYHPDRSVFDITYQWQVMNRGEQQYTDISGEESEIYHLIADNTLNGNSYRCVISDDVNSLASNGATLSVSYAAPSIVTQPVNQTVAYNAQVSFLVVASGTVEGYQWEVSTDYGSTWANYTGEDAQTASISFTATTQDGYKYRCKVSNDGGTATSNSAMLIIESSSLPPAITTQPQNQTVASGSSATFSVTASGDDLSYQWQTYRNGAWSSIGGATSASYTVAGAESLTGSKYHCIVSNEAGAVISGEATLTVTAAQEVTTPTITTQPQSVTVQEGSAASFRVAASGGGLSYQWQVNNGGTWYDVTGATNAAYNIKTVLGDNGKQYRCVVSNAAGTVTSNAANLTVTPKPDEPVTPVDYDTTAEMQVMIDGVDITAWIAHRGVKWSRNDIDGPGAGRNIVGEMIRDRVSTKMRLDITCVPLKDRQHTQLMNLLMPEFVNVLYKDPVYGVVTKVMYSNNHSSEYLMPRYDGEYWHNITFPLIEK